MMTETRRPIRLLTLMTAFLLIVAALIASAAETRADGPATDAQAKRPAIVQDANVSSGTLDVTAKRLWTREEMLNAKNADLIEVDDATFKSMTQDAMKEVMGTPGADAAGLPDAKALKSALGADALLPDADAAAPLGFDGLFGYSYPGPYSRYQVSASYTSYPYITVGKVFFRDNAGSWVCSASSVGNYAVWTAGHCVHGGKGSTWVRDFVFVPAYKDGNAPLGQWTAHHFWAKTDWINNTNFRRDMGGAVLNTRNGQKISQVVGWLGFSWNYPYEQNWTVLGYPQAAPFNGQRMWVCKAPFAYQLNPAGSGPSTQAIGCDLTGGVSGGPWIRDFLSGNHINGLASYRRTGYSQELASPHFTDEAKSLKDALVNDHP